MVGAGHHRFVMLDQHHRIAPVAELADDVEELAGVAGMEADGRLVEDEEGVDQRIAQARGQVDPRDLATGESPGRPVEGEVAEADVAEVAETGEDLLMKPERGLIVRRERQSLDEGERLAQRQGVDLGDGPFHAVAAGEVEAERRRLKAGSPAGRAILVGAVAGEHHPDVHLVALRFEPLEESLHAVPATHLGDFLDGPPLGQFPLDHEALIGLVHPGERDVDGDLLAAAGFQQVALRLGHLRPLESLHHPLADGQAPVGKSPLVIDLDRPSETPASRAGAAGMIERKKRRSRLRQLRPVIGTDEGAGVTVLGEGTLLHGRLKEAELSLAEAERGLDRLGEPRDVAGGIGDPVLNHQHLGGGGGLGLFRGQIVEPLDLALAPDAEETLGAEELPGGSERRSLGKRNREGDQHLALQ